MAADGLVPLGEAIRSLRAELLQAMEDARGSELRFALGPVELEFQLTATTEASAGGAVRFWVIDADAKGSRASGSTHTLRVTLTPVHASKVEDGDGRRADHVRAAPAFGLGAPRGAGAVVSRVVQVFAPSGTDGRGRHSSGVVLAPGLVLTARHALDGCDGDPEVRLLSGDPRWHACDVAWVGEGDCDAALLRVRGDEALGAGGALRLGRLVGERRVGALRAVGLSLGAGRDRRA